MKNLSNDIYVGMKYKDFTVISFDDESGGHGKHFRWNIQCKCGKIKNVRSQCIRQNISFRCTCNRNFEDLTGKIYHSIIVCGFAGYDTRYNRRKPQWFYQCLKCGLIKISTSEIIKRGCIKTCYSKDCRPQGENHARFKPDGVSRETRSDAKRRTWSRKIFERDNFKCVCCDDTKIQAHHMDGWHWCKEKRFDIDNGVTLCKGKLSGCHYEFHKIYGSEHNTKEQFEEFLFNKCGKTLDEILQIKGNSQ